MGIQLSVFILFLFTILGCRPRSITGAEYMINGPRLGKVTVVNISEDVRFAPQSGVLTVGDSLQEESPVLQKLIDFLLENPESTAEVKVSHVYKSEDYQSEGLIKSKNLEEYFVSRGIDPARITHSTFFDRRSKYPYNSNFRKVLVVIENVP